LQTLSIEEKNPFVCKECGWRFPEELVENLIKKKEETIYCEQCGTANNSKDFSERQISQKIQQEKSKTLFSLLKSAKKKSTEHKKKIESNLDEVKKK